MNRPKTSLLVSLLAASALPSPSVGQIVTGNGNTLILNSDASQDTNGNGRWEDLSAVSGVDFLLDASNLRGTGTSLLPGISASYTFTGSGGVIATTGQAGMQLALEGTSTATSFQSLNYNPADNDASNESITLELWFKPDDLLGQEVLWEDGGGTGLGLFLNDGNLEVRKLPGAGVVATFDMSSLAGGGTSDFTQAVVQFSVAPNPDTISLFINGTAVASTVSTANNAGDWSGGDAFGLGTRGGENMGGIGNGSSGQSSFDGEIAIFRAYRNDLLTSQQIQRNYSLVSGLTVPGQNISFFTGTSGSTWNAPVSWDTGSLPVATDSMTVINNGNSVVVSDPGLVVNTLLVGSDINGTGAPAGAGALDVTGGDLTVTTNLNIGGAGAGNTGTVTNSGGSLNIIENLLFDAMGSANSGNTFVHSAGTTTVTGSVIFDPTNLNNPDGGNGGGGTLSITGGTFSTHTVQTSETATSNVSLSGTGSWVFTGGQVDSRLVNTLTMADTSDLQFTLARASGFSPLTVNGTATLADTTTITIGTAADPVAAPLAETTAASNITWVSATPADWTDGAPDGTGAFQSGSTIDVLFAGSLAGSTPASGNPNWAISIDAGDPNNLIATRTGPNLDLGPIHAVIDTSSGTVTRSTALTIAEAPSSIGASASRLSVRNDGVLNVNSNLIIGNSGGAGVVTAGVAGGSASPELNITGNVQFGTNAGDFGGELAVDEGAVTITGNVLKGNAGVGNSTVSISGGTLTFDSSIEADFFVLGDKMDQGGTFTLTSGKSIDAAQQFIAGRVGSGQFINDGGTVTANEMIIGSADNLASEGSADNSSYEQLSGATIVSGFVHLGDDPTGNGADGAVLSIRGGTFTAGSGLRAAHTINSGEGGNPSIINVGGNGLNPTVIVNSGNLETAENAGGRFNLLDGTVFLNNGNFIIGQSASSNSDTNLTGGIMDLRGQTGTNTTQDINFNVGTGTLTIDGADVFASNNINMGSQGQPNAARTNRLELISGNLFVRDDINTRPNGTAVGNKVDIIDIDGGSLIFGEGFAEGASGPEGNAIRFEAVPGQAGANTFNVFDWSGGTIRGLDAVVGIANITGSDANSPTGGGLGGPANFYQAGGTFVVEGGTTTLDGNYTIAATATLQTIFTADDTLANTPNPTPNRAIFIDPDNDAATATGNGESIFFTSGYNLEIVGSGGQGDTSLGNAVIFDADSTLVWDATAANWTSDTLPTFAASGVVAAPGDSLVIAESSEGALLGAPLGATVVDAANWLLSLGTNDQTGTGIINNQLIATRQNVDLIGNAAALAIIDATAGGLVQRPTDLLLSTEATSAAAASALQVDAQGLNLSGTSNLIIGSGAVGQPGESFVNQNGGSVTVGGDLMFGNTSGANGGEYNLTAGSLHVAGNVLPLTVGENADINFDGGSATFGGTVHLEDLGVGRKAGSNSIVTFTNQTFSLSDDLIVGDDGTATGNLTLTTGSVINVGDDVILGSQSGSSGTLTVIGNALLNSSDALVVADAGTANMTLGDSTAGPQPNLSFVRTDIGLNDGSMGTFTILNGTYTGTGGLFIATNANATGALIIGDGTVNSNPTITITGGNTETANAGIGTLTINSGTYHQAGSNFIVGQVAGSDATLNINGGAVNVSNQMRISNAGKGMVNVTGGILTINNTLDLGNTADTEGGTLNLSGTGVLQLNNQLVIANAPVLGTASEVSISAGVANITGNTTVGAAGEGSMSLTGVAPGEEHNFQGLFIVGSANNAISKGTVTVNMANSTDTVNLAQVRLGANGQARMDVIEGIVNVAGSLNVAFSANSSTANGRAAVFTLGDGSSSPTLNVSGGNFEAALEGDGFVTIKSGTYNQNTNNLIIGQRSGSNATVLIEGGDVNTHSGGLIRIGNADAATGSLEIQGGTVDSGGIDFGGNSAAGVSTNSGTYLQSGGTVTTGAFTIANGSNNIAVTNGSLVMTSLNLDADPLDAGSTVSFTGGQISTGTLDYRNGFTNLTVGGTADVNINGNLLIDGGGTVTNPNKFIVSGAGASIDVTQNLTITGTTERYLSFQALSPTLTPGSTLTVLGDVAVGGTLELLDWATIFSTSVGFGPITLIDNQGSNAVTGLFTQTDGSLWNEGDTWISSYGDGSSWSLSYMGGTGNDVVLSSVIIPEPSRALLLITGIGLAIMRRRR